VSRKEEELCLCGGYVGKKLAGSGRQAGWQCCGAEPALLGAREGGRKVGGSGGMGVSVCWERWKPKATR